MRRVLIALLLVFAAGFAIRSGPSSGHKFSCVSEEAFRFVPLSDTIGQADAVFAGVRLPQESTGPAPIDVNAVYTGEVGPIEHVDYIAYCPNEPSVYVATEPARPVNWRGSQDRWVHAYPVTPEHLALIEAKYGPASGPDRGIMLAMTRVPGRTWAAGLTVVGAISVLVVGRKADPDGTRASNNASSAHDQESLSL